MLLNVTVKLNFKYNFNKFNTVSRFKPSCGELVRHYFFFSYRGSRQLHKTRRQLICIFLYCLLQVCVTLYFYWFAYVFLCTYVCIYLLYKKYEGNTVSHHRQALWGCRRQPPRTREESWFVFFFLVFYRLNNYRRNHKWPVVVLWSCNRVCHTITGIITEGWFFFSKYFCWNKRELRDI